MPDEDRGGFVYLTGRSLPISVRDDNDHLIHFIIESSTLRFERYTERGLIISKAKYKLTAEVLSEDLKHGAPFGASVIMACKNGHYVGTKARRVYAGQVRLEDLNPIFETGFGDPPLMTAIQIRSGTIRTKPLIRALVREKVREVALGRSMPRARIREGRQWIGAQGWGMAEAVCVGEQQK